VVPTIINFKNKNLSAAIMSIGFSVDIPAHIVYHFYKTGVSEINENNILSEQKNVEERLRDCLSSIAFPILEAGISTLICVSSLFLVDLVNFYNIFL
jgi:hypothetical protein